MLRSSVALLCSLVTLVVGACTATLTAWGQSALLQEEVPRMTSFLPLFNNVAETKKRERERQSGLS